MKIVMFVFLLFVLKPVFSQQFIDNGKIEFEVRVNNHKIYGDGIFGEMYKDKMPQFSTSWYQFIFDQNKAVYKLDHINESDKIPFRTNNEDENIWYSDYNKGVYINQKFVFDNTYLLSDSLMNIKWKVVPNETRIIAGFNCRKAEGIIFDSVYVFAFYTDEILISGGPMGIHGLPGMILGITIPRMYTSWIATKVDITGISSAAIQPPQKGKKKPAKELQETIKKGAIVPNGFVI